MAKVENEFLEAKGSERRVSDAAFPPAQAYTRYWQPKDRLASASIRPSS